VTTAAVVLAAGAGSRFTGDGHKLLAPLRGRPVVVWAVEAALAAGLDEVVVVTGAVDLGGVLPAGVRVVHNPAWANGQASSLRAGIDAATAAGHDAVVVGLGDQPGVTAAAWQAVAASSAPLATATFGDEMRPPVRIAQELWAELPEDGDEGARVLIRSRPGLVVRVPCGDSVDDAADVDTLEDLERWN
jgi:molybdenum cofactor cytidylyltransferase